MQRDEAGGVGRGPAGAAVTAALPVAWAVVTVAAGSAGCGADERPGPDPASRDTVLERMALEAVPRVERAAGLEFRRAPRLARAGEEKLRRYVRRRLDDQLPPSRAEGVERAYARLGLLPDTVELRPLLASLYLSQIVGYYAPSVDTLFVRAGVGGGALEPVLVHELVHALQDQHMDLDSLLAARRGSNDATAAAQAALEGHATYVMLADALRRRAGADVDPSALDLGALLRRVDLSSLGGAPRLAGAPRVIRESLLFPYTGGLAFVQGWWERVGGRPAPLGERTPASTEQVLHPARFAGTARDRPTEVSFPAPPGTGWSVVHADGLGEFEARLLLETHLADTARARRAAEGWDGDRYRLLEAPAGGEVLVWASVWDGAGDAAEFAEAVQTALAARYGDAGGASRSGGGRPGSDVVRAAGRRVTVRRRRVAGRPVVIVTDAPAGREAPLPAALADVSLEPGTP